MGFEYTAEQEKLKEEIRKFCEKVIRPEALFYDKRGVFPVDTIRKMGQNGLFGIMVPEPYGGRGLSTLEYCLVLEEIASFSPGYTHNGQFQVQKGLLSFGNKDQKKRFLPKLATAEYIGAIAISEHNVGSSFRKMETRGFRDGASYVLKGHKTHINDAAEADVILLLAKTEGGLTFFIVGKDTPGLTITKKLNPIGLRSSPIYEFILEEARVDTDMVLGEEGKGLDVFFGIFNFSRIGNASVFLGIANGAIRAAMEYAKERDVGGKRVTQFQGIRWILADLLTKIYAAELLRNRAAHMESEGKPCARETCMAKYFAGEVATEATNKAIEITGSHGCYRDAPYEMWMRDAKALLVAGGSSEVMKNVIADLEIGK